MIAGICSQENHTHHIVRQSFDLLFLTSVKEKYFHFLISCTQSSLHLIGRMTSLLSGITLKPVRQIPEKWADVGKKVQMEAEDLKTITQGETKQMKRSVKEVKKLPSANEQKTANIRRVTKKLFVETNKPGNRESRETAGDLIAENSETNKSETFTKSTDMTNSQQEQTQKRRGSCRPCVVCDQMVDVGKVMEKHLAAKHKEQLMSIQMSNDMADCVRTKCLICEKIFVIQRMRAHVKSAHGITMVDYRRDNLAGDYC